MNDVQKAKELAKQHIEKIENISAELKSEMNNFQSENKEKEDFEFLMHHKFFPRMSEFQQKTATAFSLDLIKSDYKVLESCYDNSLLVVRSLFDHYRTLQSS